METVSSKTVKTRKSHKCFACCETSPKGSKMRVQVCAESGSIWRSYSCPKCDELMILITRSEGQSEFYDGEFSGIEDKDKFIEELKESEQERNRLRELQNKRFKERLKKQ